jgi:hypothetical protein
MTRQNRCCIDPPRIYIYIDSVENKTEGGTPFTPTCPDSDSVWCRQFGYDNAGNRSIASRTPSGANPWDAATFNSNNRIADPNWSYDNNGNIIKAPVPQTIGYDAENRQVAVCTQRSHGLPEPVRRWPNGLCL